MPKSFWFNLSVKPSDILEIAPHTWHRWYKMAHVCDRCDSRAYRAVGTRTTADTENAGASGVAVLSETSVHGRYHS